MRVYLFLGLFMAVLCATGTAQQSCASFTYQQGQMLLNPSLKIRTDAIETFIQKQLSKETATFGETGEMPIITIPVVVHIIYHTGDENVTDQQVANQLKVMNDCYRRLNADTVNTPASFKRLAADCRIQFKLAVSDPHKRATTGIVRKYTSVAKWMSDDKVKYTARGGDDAWDSNNYLNLWVCNISYVLGYASFPGGDPAVDGVVVGYNAFKWGKTAVHETGHWLGLRHIWGDEACGNDFVDDTPQQSTMTPGCPSGIRISCNNGPNGDMYMNYMDVTGDACTNLFTYGQRVRMRSLFEAEGARTSILTSYAFDAPTAGSEIPLPEEGEPQPVLLSLNLYPNPSSSEVTLDLTNNGDWVGNIITISNIQGQSLIKTVLSAKLTKINISSLKPGIYFITAKKEDGSTIKQKLVRI